MKQKTVLLSLLLCACLLAGCGGSSTGGSSSTDSSSSLDTSSSGTSSLGDSSASSSQKENATSSSASTSEGYTKEALNNALAGCYAFDVGTAGGSLKAAIAASDLVKFSAQYATKENLTAMQQDIKAWYQTLLSGDKQVLKNNWSLIYSTANQIVTAPADAAPLLSDAGVTTDFSSMNLTYGGAVAEYLNKLISAS